MEKHFIVFLNVFYIILMSHCESAKILGVFPFPSLSHQVVFRPLTQELAKRGHEVTVITTDAAFPKGQTPANFTEIDLHDLTYEIWMKLIREAMKTGKEVVKTLDSWSETVNSISEVQFRSDQVQKLLKGKTEFDLIIAEAIMEPALIFSHIYKAPIIQISSFGALVHNYEAMGAPMHPFLYPTTLSRIVHNLNIQEKLIELYYYAEMVWYMNTGFIKHEDVMLKKVFGPYVPSGKELRNSVDMLFLNSHPVWAGNVPLPPSVISIWGIYQKPEKELPEDLKSYLDSSKHGVIYMSFGTNAIPSALAADKIQAFVKVFSELPYDVLWKYDKEEIPGRSKNIRVGKWFPQSDLLRHPKIKLFITQGGLQSTEEAITAGVPLVGVPLLGDQWYNVAKYQHFKIGEKLDMATLTVDDVRQAIKTVLEDDSYRKNIANLRDIMHDEPQSALERAVWWAEYVLRHKGAKHLRAAGADVSWTEYYEIPLVLSLVSIAFVFLAFIFYCLRTVIKLFTSPRLKVKKN